MFMLLRSVYDSGASGERDHLDRVEGEILRHDGERFVEYAARQYFDVAYVAGDKSFFFKRDEVDDVAGRKVGGARSFFPRGS